MLFCLNFAVLIVGSTVGLISLLMVILYQDKEEEIQRKKELWVNGAMVVYFLVNLGNLKVLRMVLSSILKEMRREQKGTPETQRDLAERKGPLEPQSFKRHNSVPVYLVKSIFPSKSFFSFR